MSWSGQTMILSPFGSVFSAISGGTPRGADDRVSRSRGCALAGGAERDAAVRASAPKIQIVNRMRLMQVSIETAPGRRTYRCSSLATWRILDHESQPGAEGSSKGVHAMPTMHEVDYEIKGDD